MAPDLPEPDTSGTDAVNYFLPYLTLAEGEFVDAELFNLLERRAKIAYHLGRGVSYRKIAEKVKVSHVTVLKDRQVILDGYLKIAAASVRDHLAAILRRLDYLERSVQAEWEKSKRGGRAGDARLAALLLTIVDRRARLFGLLSGDAAKAADAGGRHKPLVVGGDARVGGLA